MMHLNRLLSIAGAIINIDQLIFKRNLTFLPLLIISSLSFWSTQVHQQQQNVNWNCRIVVIFPKPFKNPIHKRLQLGNTAEFGGVKLFPRYVSSFQQFPLCFFHFFFSFFFFFPIQIYFAFHQVVPFYFKISEVERTKEDARKKHVNELVERKSLFSVHVSTLFTWKSFSFFSLFLLFIHFSVFDCANMSFWTATAFACAKIEWKMNRDDTHSYNE